MGTFPASSPQLSSCTSSPGITPGRRVRPTCYIRPNSQSQALTLPSSSPRRANYVRNSESSKAGRWRRYTSVHRTPRLNTEYYLRREGPPAPHCPHTGQAFTAFGSKWIRTETCATITIRKLQMAKIPGGGGRLRLEDDGLERRLSSHDKPKMRHPAKLLGTTQQGSFSRWPGGKDTPRAHQLGIPEPPVPAHLQSHLLQTWRCFPLVSMH